MVEFSLGTPAVLGSSSLGTPAVLGSSPVVTGQKFLTDLNQVKFTSNNDSKVKISHSAVLNVKIAIITQDAVQEHRARTFPLPSPMAKW